MHRLINAPIAAVTLLVGTFLFPVNHIGAKPAIAPAVAPLAAQGDWLGQLESSPLKFRFRNDNGVWHGWFVSQKGGRLFPLQDVTIQGSSVTFKFLSKPVLTFDLKIAGDAKSMSGIIETESGMSIYRAFTRVEE